MKRFATALVLLLALTVTVVAFAADGAGVFKAKCAGCHGADGTKIASASEKDMLKGQSAEEIMTKMKGYLDETYGGKKAKLMTRAASKLSEEELAAVAEHIGKL